MALAIKAARAAKLEEQKRAEEEAKHKEEMQTAPIIDIATMADALMKAKDEIIHHEGHVHTEQETNLQDLADTKIKQTIWNDVKTTSNSKRMDLSSGIGLALLTKAMGVHKIENKYMKHIDNIRKTKLMNRMEMRIRVQKKIWQDVNRLTHRTDLDVSKMYWRSKKNVYGIDNELHLVEQV